MDAISRLGHVLKTLNIDEDQRQELVELVIGYGSECKALGWREAANATAITLEYGTARQIGA
jgi:hypothetical protein